MCTTNGLDWSNYPSTEPKPLCNAANSQLTYGETTSATKQNSSQVSALDAYSYMLSGLRPMERLTCLDEVRAHGLRVVLIASQAVGAPRVPRHLSLGTCRRAPVAGRLSVAPVKLLPP